MQRKLKKIGFEENEGFVMINVLIFSDSLTIYIVSGCQLLTFLRKKVDLFGIFFNNREKKAKNATFAEKLSLDRNGAFKICIKKPAFRLVFVQLELFLAMPNYILTRKIIGIAMFCTESPYVSATSWFSYTTPTEIEFPPA